MSAQRHAKVNMNTLYQKLIETMIDQLVNQKLW